MSVVGDRHRALFIPARLGIDLLEPHPDPKGRDHGRLWLRPRVLAERPNAYPLPPLLWTVRGATHEAASGGLEEGHMVSFLRRLFRREPSIPGLVRRRFGRIATAPGREKRRVGPDAAKGLGYEPGVIDALPGSVTESFVGVGNPLSLGELHPGETVLDLGSGAGLDSILAARLVGPTGRVLGVDMTPEMIDKARHNVQAVGLTNVAFLNASVEHMPLEDSTADVAICNGLFNLCPDKPAALAEVFRAVKPGGRLLLADILLEDHVTPEVVAHKGRWSD
jgi:arsenite methyltransferase